MTPRKLLTASITLDLLLGGCSASDPTINLGGSAGAAGALESTSSTTGSGVPDSGDNPVSGTGSTGEGIPTEVSGPVDNTPPPRDAVESEAATAIARFDEYSFAQGTVYQVAASGVLANDALEASLVSATLSTVRGGSVRLATDGSFAYQPSFPSFWGDDEFEYRASRGDTSDTAKVRLSIQPTEPLQMASVETGGNGFAIRTGQESGDSVVANAGDVNGDGFDDLVIGVPTASPNGEDRAGMVYVVYGGPADRARSFSLESLRPELGFALEGTEANARLGASVASAGDFNGDGFGDVVLGAPGARDPDVASAELAARIGAVHIVFGGSSLASGTISDVARGTTGFRITGAPFGTNLGTVVGNAGDFNGDGMEDLLLGAEAPEPDSDANEVHVVYGTREPASFKLTDLNSMRGLTVRAETGESADRPHLSATPAGDINGDGIADIAFTADASIVVLFGRLNPRGVNLLQPLDPSRGFRISAGNDYALLGSAVSAAGDFNGDGYDDLALSAGLLPQGSASNEPAAVNADLRGLYVVLGKSVPVPVDITAMGASDGVRHSISGLFPQCSEATYQISGRGDVDGDGLSDLLVALWPEGTCESTVLQKSFLIRGTASGQSFPLASLRSPAGLALQGVNPQSTDAVDIDSVGDVNGDGLDDFAVLSNEVVYLGYGWNWATDSGLRERSIALVGTPGSDELEFDGAHGLVRATGSSAPTNTTLRLTWSGTTVDARPRARLRSIEHVDLGETGTNRLILDDASLRTIAQTRPNLPAGLTRTLIVTGGPGNQLQAEDLEQYAIRGSNGDRTVYARPGAFYGLELAAGVNCTGCP